eukprot:scaffold175343_cov14-Tisochrysis_lutea.AAC.1
MVTPMQRLRRGGGRRWGRSFKQGEGMLIWSNLLGVYLFMFKAMPLENGCRRRQGHLFKLLLNSCSELVLHAHAGIIAWPE